MNPTGVAAGFVDITPNRPAVLAGYAGRTGPFDGVADPLEANVVVIHTGEAPLVLASFDLLYVGDALRHMLETALAPEILPERLFLTASHTHFAPATDATLPLLGPVDPHYVRMVAERVADLVRRLVQAPVEPLRAGSGAVATDHAVNRRCAGWRLGKRFPFLRKGVWMQPNPAGHKDDTIRVLRLGANTLVWNYACHPVFVPRMNHVSADFVGRVRTALRQAFGAATTVLFWQGFSGDIYPSFASTMTGLTARIKQALGRSADAVAARVWQEWSDRLAARVVAATRSVTLKEVHGEIDARRTALPLSELLDHQELDKHVHAHQLSIGADIQVQGMSAEMVSEYVPVVQRRLNNRSVFCVGCIDGVFGYIPTAQMIQEGGYEAGGFLPAFSLGGRFLDGIEWRVQDSFWPREIRAPRSTAA